MHAMSSHGIAVYFLKLHKKELNNRSVKYQKAIKRICVCHTYARKYECLEYAHLPIFRHFPVGKFICFAQRKFTSKSPFLVSYTQNLRGNSVFRNSLDRLSSGNNQYFSVHHHSGRSSGEIMLGSKNLYRLEYMLEPSFRPNYFKVFFKALIIL